MANPTGTINADEDHTGRKILKSDPTLNQDAATKKYVDDNAGGGATAFTDLSDVPGSYSGGSLKVVRVNTGETALEFVALSTLSANIVSDTAYDATTWNGDTTHAPSKNAVRDKFESLSGGGNVTHFGTPTFGQIGQWIDATQLQGVTLSGSGATMSIDTSGVITISAIAKASITGSPAGAFVGDTDTQTLTNKRISPRVTAITSNATWSPSADTDDIYQITAQAAAVTTISNPSGTPVNGQKLIIRVKDNGTARALSWSGSQWRASSDLALPTTTILSKTLYLGFIYNSADTKWDLLALLNNF